MAASDTRYTFDRVAGLIVTVVTIVAALWLLRYLSDVVLPFAAAVVLAYLLNPIVSFFEQKTKRRGAAVGMTLAGLGVVGIAFAILLVPLMLAQVRQFSHVVDKLRADLAGSVSYGAESTPPLFDPLGSPTGDTQVERSADGWKELKGAWTRFRTDAETKSRSARFAQFRADLEGTYAGDFLNRAIDYTRSDEFSQALVDWAKQLAIGGWTILAFAINVALGLIGLIVVLIYLVFLLMDFPEYARTWPSFLPPQYRQSIVEFTGQFSESMRRYFRGQAVVALCVGVLFAIGFTLIGLPMAVPFGLFVGLLNMVPYLQTIGLVPAVLLATLGAIEGDGGFMASVGLALLVFAIVQIIQDALLTPRIMGKATGLRPVAILLGIFVWGKLLGFLGLILAIPLTCLGIAYYRRYVLHHAPIA